MTDLSHIPTPRTDEAQFGTGRVSVDFARQLERELSEALRERDEAQGWKQACDKPLPEDPQIEAAHPVNADAGHLYVEAMRMVGARHSKAGLVALVTWIMSDRDKALRERDEATGAMIYAQNDARKVALDRSKMQQEMDILRMQRDEYAKASANGDWVDIVNIVNQRDTAIAEREKALRELDALREALQNISSNAEQNSIGGDGDDELIVSLNWIKETADEALLATEPKTE